MVLISLVNAITPKNIPANEIVVKVESAIRPPDTEQADSVRGTVNNLLQKVKPPKPNITKDMKQALKNLKEDNTIIMVLAADKGRASVVLDIETYRQKMKNFIESGPYRLHGNKKSSEELLDLNRNGHLTEHVYNKIRLPNTNS